MGLENRDWYRAETSRPGGRSRTSGALIVVAVLVGLALAAGVRHFTAETVTFAGEKRPLHGEAKLSLLPGLPAVTLYRDSLYWPHDRWTAYLADESTCPGGERADAPLADQAAVMVCLVNYARKQRGLTPLVTVSVLNGSSAAKVERIVRCKQFAHAACGRDPASDVRAAGYLGAFGENLYVAEGRYGAPRVALDGWLNSPGHRENLFRPEWRTQGIAVQKLARFGPYRAAELWVNEFGTG